MSAALADALIDALEGAGADQRRRLAELIAPYLPGQPEAGEGARWLRGADQIAAHIGCPRSRVYALASAGRIPVQHDGSALIARTTDLDDWLRAGGGRRP
ncbi:MAG: hypothetical protein ACP5H2_10470 [Solirubrobacteraceae bacterium]